MNSTDRTSSIMDLKFNHELELYTTDLKIYSLLGYRKTLMNLASKKSEHYNCSGMKEKLLEVFRSSFGSLIRDLKNKLFHFQNLRKTTGFCRKTLHKHGYENF